MPDWHIQPYHLAGKAAPRSCTVYHNVKGIFFTICRLQSCHFISISQDFCYFHAGFDHAAVFLHLLGKCIRDHSSVKIAVVLSISSSQDVLCGDIRQDFFNTILVCNIFSCISCRFCQRDPSLDRFFHLFICSDYQRSCFVESCASWFFCFHLQIGFKSVKSYVPVSVFQRVIKKTYCSCGFSCGSSADRIFLKYDYVRFIIQTQMISKCRS